MEEEGRKETKTHLPRRLRVVLRLGVDTNGDVTDETLLEDAADLEDLELGVVTVLVSVVVQAERVDPVASAAPLVGDRVGVVGPDLSRQKVSTAERFRGRRRGRKGEENAPCR
jgi:hypothetical protein